MSPAAAIRAAMLDAATLLGRADTIGTIEQGKDADFIAGAASPLDDVTERVRFVMRRGVVHKLDGNRQASAVATGPAPSADQQQHRWGN